MSFKLNDYNAFLTSLFDKNNQQQQQLEQLKQENCSQQLFTDNLAAQQELSSSQPQQQRHNSLEDSTTNNNNNNIIINKEKANSMPHISNSMSMNDDGRFPLHFDFGLVAPTFTYGSSNSKGKSSSLSHEYSLIGTPNAEAQEDMSGNMTEFIAEMGAERNGRYQRTNLADSMVLDNSVVASPDNLFNLGHIQTNASSYSSDFATFDEDPSLQRQQSHPQQQSIPHQLGGQLSHENSFDSFGSMENNNNNNLNQAMKQETSVLGTPTSNQLTKRASNITFGGVNTQPLPRAPNESPPISPLNQVAKLSNKPGRKAKSFDYTEQGNDGLITSPTQSNYNHPGRPRVKSAHNVIEQRYRNKINDKFNALQNSVPTLRILAQRKEREKLQIKQQHLHESGGDEYDSMSDEEVDLGLVQDEIIDLEGLEPARKLNKGTILAKSIEYIKFLELKNDRMKQENEKLIMKARMLGLNIDNESNFKTENKT